MHQRVVLVYRSKSIVVFKYNLVNYSHILRVALGQVFN